MSCICAKPTDQYHGWECTITDDACAFLIPNSKECARIFDEGPDTVENISLIWVAKCNSCGTNASGYTRAQALQKLSGKGCKIWSNCKGLRSYCSCGTTNTVILYPRVRRFRDEMV